MQSSGLLLERLAWIEEIIETMGKRPQGYVRCLKMTAPREIFTRRFSERRPRDLSTFSPTPCKGKLTNACVASLSHPNYGFSSPRYSLIPSLETIALKFWQPPTVLTPWLCKVKELPSWPPLRFQRIWRPLSIEHQPLRVPAQIGPPQEKCLLMLQKGSRLDSTTIKLLVCKCQPRKMGDIRLQPPCVVLMPKLSKHSKGSRLNLTSQGPSSLGQETEHGVEKDFSSFKIKCFFPVEF